MRNHLAVQTFPAWPEVTSETVVGTATYVCHYDPASGSDPNEPEPFRSEATELSWRLEYEIPDELTTEQRAVLPPLTRLVRKTFKDPAGQVVDTQFAPVTLNPGETSTEFTTTAVGAPSLPDGGTVTLDLLPGARERGQEAKIDNWICAEQDWRWPAASAFNRQVLTIM